MDLAHRHIGGEAQRYVTEALGIPVDSPLRDVLAEIARLKMAAAEGPQKKKKRTPMKLLAEGD